MRRSETQDTDVAKSRPGATGYRAGIVVGALLLGLVVLFVIFRPQQPPPQAKEPAPALLRVADTVTLEPPPPPTDERREFRDAILRLEKLRAEVRVTPNEVSTQVALVQEAVRAGDLLTARAACREAVRLGPQAKGPLYDTWGFAALRLGLIEEALKTQRAFLREAPQEVMAHLGLHRVLNKTGQKAAVGDVLKRALTSLRPDDVQGRLMLVQEYERSGLLVYALEETQRLHKAAPENPQATLALATILVRMHRLEQAQPLLQTLVATHPNYSDAHSTLADLYDSPLCSNRDRARAEHHYLQAIQLDPNVPDYYENLAQICFDQERYSQAAFLYIQALKRRPDSSSARQHLAAAYAHLDDARASREQSEIARRLTARDREEERINVLLEQRPTDPKVRLTIARRYTANGLLRKALPELQAAYCLGADATQIQRELRSLYQRIGVTAPTLPKKRFVREARFPNPATPSLRLRYIFAGRMHPEVEAGGNNDNG